jgi:gliding motility-associated-like protein
MRKFLLIFALSLYSAAGFSQTIVNYPTPFQANNQNLWKAGADGVFQIDHSFFNMTWDESITFGPMYSLAGYDFGAKVTAGTWGQIGAGLKMNFGTEQVSVKYFGDMHIQKPDQFTFNKGDLISLKTSYIPNPAASTIVTDTYHTNMRLYLKFGMGIDLAAKICMFDCANINLVDINLPVKEYDMVSISNITGINLLNGLYSWGPEEAFPFNYSDSRGIITLDVTLPSNAGANIYMQNNNLHSFADPDDPYFNIYYSIPKFIGALHIPYVSAFFANLSNSYSSGPFYLNYILMESGLNLGLYHKQHLTLEPELKGRLDLPLALDYEIVNPNNGAVTAAGNSSSIEYTPGEEIRLEYPCHYDFMEITPSFEMDNRFTNHTYDSIALDFVFQMLEFNMGMEPITVVPAFCEDIPYPCPTWSNPLKICWKEICTPSVGFDGFETGFGPLVDWQPNMAELTYDWRRSSWEMDGFNSFQNQAPFKLEPAKMEVILTAENILCYGAKNGKLTAEVQNGRPPYVYEWSNGAEPTSAETTNTQVGLAPGTHYVRITDANGCSVFASSEISQPDAPLALTAVQVNPLCYGSNTGSIETEVTGGTPPYTYAWSTGATSPDIYSLQAGEYTLTVTDDNGCLISETFTLTQPDALIAEITSGNVLCKGGDDGYISVEVSGGIKPYSYNWSNGHTEKSHEQLIAGTYNITITDANGCELNESVQITEPSENLTLSQSITDISCYGNSDGEIQVNPLGGTSPYSFKWYDSESNVLNETGSLLSNAPAGDYRVTVTDDNGCVRTLESVINQPEPISHSFDVEDVLCKGLSEGQITLNVQGGTSPYSYLWSNGSETQNISDIPAGEYSVTVTDANNCKQEFETEVSEPKNEFTVQTEVSDVLCYGETTGSIKANPDGGVSPYTFSWSNGSSAQNLTNIAAGSYTLTAVDNNGCTYFSGAVVSQPDEPLTAVSEVSPISCYGYNDGAVYLELSGGTLPYELNWDNNTHVLNENQQSLEKLEPGFLNITLSDANKCSDTYSFYIESPDPVSIELNSSLVSCYEGSDAILTADIQGGTEPYNYEWSNGSRDEMLENIPAGNYGLELTDANGCVYTAAKEVLSYSEIKTDYEVIPPSCKDINDGSVLLNPIGGAGEYSYNWSDGQQTQNAHNLEPGIHSVTITDENNCEESFEFDIPYNYDECLSIPTVFTPNNDGKNDTWYITGMEAYSNASVQVFNKWGKLLFELNGLYQPWDGTYKGNALPAETYYYIINLNNGDEPYTGTITILR